MHSLPQRRPQVTEIRTFAGNTAVFNMPGSWSRNGTDLWTGDAIRESEEHSHSSFEVAEAGQGVAFAGEVFGEDVAIAVPGLPGERAGLAVRPASGDHAAAGIFFDQVAEIVELVAGDAAQVVCGSLLWAGKNAVN